MAIIKKKLQRLLKYSEVIKINKTLVQCDFDGTITEEDVSFLILEKYSSKDWHLWLNRYNEGKISASDFNTNVFSHIKNDRRTLVDFVSKHDKVRPGFIELLSYCRRNKLEFVIISNGLDFYIDYILTELGINDLRIIAARTEFDPRGMKIKYLGPDGSLLIDGFKEAYTKHYINSGYRIIYVGNGLSDLPAARLSYHIFSRDDLTECCIKTGLAYTPFEDLNDVIKGLDRVI